MLSLVAARHCVDTFECLAGHIGLKRDLETREKKKRSHGDKIASLDVEVDEKAPHGPGSLEVFQASILSAAWSFHYGGYARGVPRIAMRGLRMYYGALEATRS
ncbi:hypothetical protein HAX54_044198 [Datura stramonium]|uniref:Uncharacterized protein n=1 Tax=Datura stramonium TaxID=4076 RepID=A0ABS8W491_DATST|nr:hypothetical protein [Datura stramonium]